MLKIDNISIYSLLMKDSVVTMKVLKSEIIFAKPS
jgi:hypothetical protein